MRKTFAAASGLAMIAMAAAHGAAPRSGSGAINEIEAQRIFDKTVAAWTSMDAARIKALYAPDIAGYDIDIGPLSTDRASWDKAQDAFASARFDGAKIIAQKIQLIDTITFVVSSTADITSSTMPQNNVTIRCTDVYVKRGDGRWPIVNEHCSAMPKPS